LLTDRVEGLGNYEERLAHMRVWQATERLMAEVDRLAGLVRNGAGNAADRLERSAEAVLFNTGEGIGAYKPHARINAYEVAKKEATESRALLGRLVIKRALSTRDGNKPTSWPAW
jgi:four helix bundle protein